MKKILMILAFCAVLSGCNSKNVTESESIVVTESVTNVNEKEETKQEEVASTIKDIEFIDGFEKANFDKFNSPASENGLGGTLIFVDGIVNSKIEADNVLSFLLKQDDGCSWIISVTGNPKDDGYIVDSIIGQEVRVFGEYIGYSTVYNMPSIAVANEKGHIDEKEADGSYKKIFDFYEYYIQQTKTDSSDTNSIIVSQLKELYKKESGELTYSDEDSQKYFEIVLKSSKEIAKRGENAELEEFVDDELFNPFVLSAGYLCNNYNEDTEYGKVGNMAFDLIGYIVAKDNDNRDKILNEYNTKAANHGMEIITIDDSENTTGESNETEFQEPIELSTGKYIVGEDIPSGKYDVIGVERGNIFVSSNGGKSANELIESIISGEIVYANLRLNDGYEVEITSGGKIQLQPK